MAGGRDVKGQHLQPLDHVVVVNRNSSKASECIVWMRDTTKLKETISQERGYASGAQHDFDCGCNTSRHPVRTCIGAIVLVSHSARAMCKRPEILNYRVYFRQIGGGVCFCYWKVLIQGKPGMRVPGVLGVRCVGIRKADGARRPSLVAKDIETYNAPGVFAATPPMRHGSADFFVWGGTRRRITCMLASFAHTSKQLRFMTHTPKRPAQDYAHHARRNTRRSKHGHSRCSQTLQELGFRFQHVRVGARARLRFRGALKHVPLHAAGRSKVKVAVSSPNGPKHPTVASSRHRRALHMKATIDAQTGSSMS